MKLQTKGTNDPPAIWRFVGFPNLPPGGARGSLKGIPLYNRQKRANVIKDGPLPLGMNEVARQIL